MIQINHIYKTYLANNKRQDVLKDVSFSLPEKGLFFIVGKSGSGKSTLLNLIGGMDKPDQGSILIDGKDITEMKEKELAAAYEKTAAFPHLYRCGHIEGKSAVVACSCPVSISASL